jgi:hypothetical protein
MLEGVVCATTLLVASRRIKKLIRRFFMVVKLKWVWSSRLCQFEIFIGKPVNKIMCHDIIIPTVVFEIIVGIIAVMQNVMA